VGLFTSPNEAFLTSFGDPVVAEVGVRVVVAMVEDGVVDGSRSNGQGTLHPFALSRQSQCPLTILSSSGGGSHIDMDVDVLGVGFIRASGTEGESLQSTPDLGEDPPLADPPPPHACSTRKVHRLYDRPRLCAHALQLLTLGDGKWVPRINRCLCPSSWLRLCFLTLRPCCEEQLKVSLPRD